MTTNLGKNTGTKQVHPDPYMKMRGVTCGGHPVCKAGLRQTWREDSPNCESQWQGYPRSQQEFGEKSGLASGLRSLLFVAILFGLLLGSGVQVVADTARGYMKKGLEKMEEEQYLAAATNFQAAAELAAGQNRDPAVPSYNAGNAFYNAKKWNEARSSYAKALESEDVDLQAKAYYNRGNVELKCAEKALKDELPKQTIQHYDKAASDYEKSITLAPKFMDPKVNYEIAGRRKHELLSRVDVAKSNIKKARDMIGKHKYVAAVRFMRKQMSEHKLAFKLEPELKKKYEELLKRTGQIAKIVVDTQKNQKDINNVQ